jgi:hypothetical protein
VSPKPATRAYPGEQCSSNSGCLTGLCTKSVCQGSTTFCSLNITNNALCAPGYYCDLSLSNPVCTPLKLNLTSCTANDQCTYGSGCYNKVNCLSYGSIPNYKPIESSECTSSIGYTLYCQSAQCYNFGNGTSICVEAFESPYYQNPFQCYESSACVSNINSKIGAALQGSCNCAKNAEGSAYCSQFVGDYYFAKAKSLWENWEKSGYLKKCNIDAAYTPGCLLSYLKSNDAYEIMLYNYLANTYPQFEGADNCTLSVFYSDYLLYKSEYTPQKNNDNFALAMASVIALVWF